MLPKTVAIVRSGGFSKVTQRVSFCTDETAEVYSVMSMDESADIYDDKGVHLLELSYPS